MTEVQFAKFNDAERKIVNAIAKRAVKTKLYSKVIDVEMDISAVHADVPLRLADLLAADDFNFSHDLGGIRRHLNRQTGKLGDFFLPRMAAPQA